MMVSDESGTGVATDALGNVFVTGTFRSSDYWRNATVTFDEITLTNSSREQSDFFVAKFNSAGVALWAQSSRGEYLERASDIAVAANGDVYITGYFTSPTALFGPFTVTNSTGGQQGFLAKYDNDGNVIWAKEAGLGRSCPLSIALDETRGIYIGGWFGLTNLRIGSETLTNTHPNSSEAFIARFDFSGGEVWARSAGGMGDDQALALDLDTQGNAYVAGSFTSTNAHFEHFTLTNPVPLYSDVFLAKYDSSGTALWAKSAVGSFADEAAALTVSSEGVAYLTGYFKSTNIAFEGVVLTNASGPINSRYDAFVAKYASSGDVLWAKRYGGGEDDRARAITLDGDGGLFFAGEFYSPVLEFGDFTLTNSGPTARYDVFVAKLETGDGTPLWAKRAGAGNGNESIGDLAATVERKIVITGSFSSGVSGFDDLTLVNSYWPNLDFYLAKLGYSPPILGITLSNGLVQLSWPADAAGFSLEQNTSSMLLPWNVVTNPPTLVDNQKIVTIGATNTTRLYRLRR